MAMVHQCDEVWQPSALLIETLIDINMTQLVIGVRVSIGEVG
jgi:hypothetical protein